MIELRPATLKEANAFVAEHHRHHKPVVGHRFSVAAEIDGSIVGVVIVGRPVAPAIDSSRTSEVTRLCCVGGEQNVGSRLLGAAWRASKAMWCVRCISYTRVDEPGGVYRAAGWRPVATTEGRSWNTGNKSTRWLPGLYEPTTEVIDRVRWEIP